MCDSVSDIASLIAGYATRVWDRQDYPSINRPDVIRFSFATGRL
ncbi:MAG: hypothetical protein QOD11_2781 [Bradyrhizobium sp.]|jgi:hypothetical protein|nr:hypothetical protein [Bradyrhizobium sp.]